MNFIRNQRGLFAVRYPYKNPLDRRRAAALARVLWLVLVSSLVTILAIQLPRLFAGESFDLTDILFVVVPPAASIISLVLLQRGELRIASGAFLLMIIPIVLAAVAVVNINSPLIIVLIIPIAIAGLLLSRRASFATTVIIVFFAALISISELDGLRNALSDLPLMVALSTVLMLGFLFVIFSGTSDELVSQSLENVERFRAASRFIVDVDTSDEMTTYVEFLNLMRENLGNNFTQIFLADDTGAISRRVRVGMTRNQSLMINPVTLGDASGVVQAAMQRQVIAMTTADSLVRRSHFLPSTQFGMLLPFAVQGRVVGIVDVQRVETRFSEEQIAVLRSAVAQLGKIVENQRVSSELRQQLERQQVSLESLRRQLSDYREREGQVIASTWDAYLSQRSQEAVGFDLAKLEDDTGIRLEPAFDLNDAVHASLSRGEITVERLEDCQQVRVPLQIQGETLGAMAFDIDLNARLSDRHLEFVQNLANRLTLALENKRLFEQSQAQASRERKASEIGGLLLGATDVRQVIERASESFNEALGAVRTRVSVELDALEDRPVSNGKSSSIGDES